MHRLIGLSLVSLAVCLAATVASAHPPAKVKLRVVVGGGTVGVIRVGPPSGKKHTCLIDCTYLYARGTKITVTAAGAKNVTRFVSWSGACHGTSHVCRLTLSTNSETTAKFAIGG